MSRDHRTSVDGKNYILHVPRPEHHDRSLNMRKTLCGIYVIRVNCVGGDGSQDRGTEMVCQRCALLERMREAKASRR